MEPVKEENVKDPLASVIRSRSRVTSWVWDIESERLIWAPASIHIFGSLPYKKINTWSKFASHLHPDDVSEFHQRLAKMRSEGLALEQELRLVLNNRSGWFNLSGSPFFDATGKPIRVVGTLRDISREINLLTQIENSPDPLLIYDSEGDISYLNSRFTEVFGWSLKELNREKDRFIPADLTLEMQDIGRELAAEGRVIQLETRRLTKAQEVREVEISAGVFTDHRGTPDGIYVLFRDITQRKQLEQELHQHRNQLEMLVDERTEELEASKRTLVEQEIAQRLQIAAFEQVSEAIMIVDPDFNLNVMNRAAARMYEVNPHEVIGKPLDTFIVNTEYDHFDRQTGMDMLFTEGQFRDSATQTLRDGRVLRIEAGVTLARNQAGEPINFVIVNRDIRDKEQSQRDLEDRNTFLNLIIENIPHRIYWKDLYGNYQGGNQAFAADVGLEEAQALIGLDDHALPFITENVESRIADDQAVILDHKIVSGRQDKIQVASDETIEIRIDKVPLQDANGETVGVLGMYEDITQQLLLESDVEEKNILLNSILDTIPQSVFWKDVNSVFLGCNRAFSERLGLTSTNELIGQNDYDRWPAEQAAQYIADDQEVMDTGISKLNIIERRQNQHGGTSTLQTNKVPLRDANGNIIGVLGTFADISELVQAEDQIRYQASLLEYTSDAIVASDTNFVVQTWNKAAERLYGFTAEETIGKHGNDFLKTDYIGIEDMEVLRQLQERGTFNARAIQTTTNGRELIIDASLSMITNYAGEPIGFVGVNRDVTSIVQAQEQLQYQSDLLEYTSDAIVAVDTNFIVQSWNAACERLYGFAAEDVLGKQLSDFLTTEYFTVDRENVREVLIRDGKFVGQAIQKTTNGREILIDASLSVITNNDEEVVGFVAVNRDVTFEKEAAAESKRLQSILENTTDFVGIAQPDGQLTFVNKAGRDMIGLSPDDPLDGLRAIDLASEAYQDQLISGIEIASRRETWFGESLLKRIDDGPALPVSIVITAYEDGQGGIAYFSAIARDISNQRRYAEQVEARLQLTQLLNTATTESEILEIIGKYTPSNEKAMHVITRSPSETEWGEHGIARQKFIYTPNVKLDEPVWFTYSGAVMDQLALNQPFVSIDLQTDDRITDTTKSWALQNDIHSNAVFPIFENQDTLYGTLNVHSNLIGYFTPDVTTQYQAIAEEAGLALRNVRLGLEVQQTLERRNREVELITRIAQDVTAAGGLLEIYRRLVQQVQETFGYYYTQILRYNESLDAMTIIAGYGEVGQALEATVHTMPMGKGLIGTAAATGQSILRPDVAADPDWASNELLPKTRGELAVPIKFQDQIYGVLDVQSDRKNALSLDDQILLEGICGVIATAIESTRLQQAMETQIEELNELQRVVTRSGWEATRNRLTHGFLFEEGTVRPLNGGNDSNGRSENGVDQSSTTGFLVSKPISIRGETFGTLAIQDSISKPLTQEERELLDAVSLQVAEALENARLFEETQRQAAELKTVADLGSTTSAILDRKQLLQSITDLTSEGFNIEHVNIYTIDEGRQVLAFEAGSGHIGAVLASESPALSFSHRTVPTVKAFHTQQPHYETDLYQKQAIHPLLSHIRSWLALPLISSGEIFGVLNLMTSKENAFHQNDIPIFTTLANQVGTTVNNIELFDEQKETAEKLREVDRLKSEFLASMSHELRTPLNSIIGFADVLLEGIDGELNDRMEEDIRLIRDGGHHLRNLIGEILDMSKIEAGMMDLSYSEVDLQRIGHEVSTITTGLIKDKPLEMVTHISPDIGKIEADRVRLVQIFLNILSNAAKFTDEGTITLTMSREPEHLLVKIADSGIGIADEDIPLVFQQFRQVGGIQNRKAGGTGLGMPITKNLVELHGGEIWLESVQGVGTTFFFTIPNKRPKRSEVEGDKNRYYA